MDTLELLHKEMAGDKEVIRNLADELDEAENTIKELKGSLANLFNDLLLYTTSLEFQHLLEDSFTIRTLYSKYGEEAESENSRSQYDYPYEDNKDEQ